LPRLLQQLTAALLLSRAVCGLQAGSFGPALGQDGLIVLAA